MRILIALLFLVFTPGAFAASVTDSAELDEKLKSIPQDKRSRVYLVRRADGLESGAIGSINTEILERWRSERRR